MKKGGAPNTNLKTRHPYELLSGIHPDADNEAMKILQSNRYLTNAFLRLYNHAYHLESETAKLELRIKLNNLLKNYHLFSHFINVFKQKSNNSLYDLHL